MKFNKNNYHQGSKGTFNIVSTHKLKSMWNSFTLQGLNLKTVETGDKFTFKDKTYEFSFISYGKYGSLSIYFIVDDRQLLRLSDHWSEGCKNLIVKECGSIRRCHWKLQGNSFPFYLNAGQEVPKKKWGTSYYGNDYWTWTQKEITNCLLGGIININELKHN